MKLHEAYSLAEKIKRLLAPMCERIEIAGSIRRARPEVNDIDFVLQPRSNDAAEELRAILRKCPVVRDGRQFMEVRSKEGVIVDVWFAHGGAGDMFERVPSNFGSLLLCRTGSKEHNVWLCERARAMEMKWETSRGLVAHPETVKEKIVASATEEEIFAALGLPFIPPVEREKKSQAQSPTSTVEATDWSQAFATVDEVQQLAGAVADEIKRVADGASRGVVRIPGLGGAFID
jgi:DNA polymerase (family X)